MNVDESDGNSNKAVAVNTTLLAFAAERRVAVDMDRKAAAPVRGAHSSKPAARCGCGAIWDGQTDR